MIFIFVPTLNSLTPSPYIKGNPLNRCTFITGKTPLEELHEQREIRSEWHDNKSSIDSYNGDPPKKTSFRADHLRLTNGTNTTDHFVQRITIVKTYGGFIVASFWVNFSMLVESLKWRLSRDKRASVLGIPFYGSVSVLRFVFWFCSIMLLPFCFIV